jgi:hypothetical protein
VVNQLTFKITNPQDQLITQDFHSNPQDWPICWLLVVIAPMLQPLLVVAAKRLFMHLAVYAKVDSNACYTYIMSIVYSITV